MIRLFAARAEKACPGVKVRFVQRDMDAAETLLIVGLQAPTRERGENRDLYSVPHELSQEHEDIVVTLTESTAPVDGKQLLNIRKLLNKDQLASDLIEPPPITLRKRLHDFTKDWTFFFIVSLLYVLGYATGVLHTQDNQPDLHHGNLTPAHVKTLDETVNETMQQIDEEMKKENVKISPKRLEGLQTSKKNLGQAWKTLMKTKYPELDSAPATTPTPTPTPKSNSH